MPQRATKMKQVLAIIILLFLGISAKTQQNYPSEWVKYISDGYFYDIESSYNKQDALDLARSNLAKQIQVVVKDAGQLDKKVVNGITDIYYTSQTNFITDLVLNRSETQSYYNHTLDKHFVIVYINKNNARTFYENDVKRIISNINNVISTADNYINAGFKSKAKSELDNSSSWFDDAKKALFWLNVLELDENKFHQYVENINQLEQTVKLMSAKLEYGTTYCVVCKADIFGKDYPTLKNEIKGELSTLGCNFVDDPNQADYVIYVDASARKHPVSHTDNTPYYAYIDATITIDKVATKQRIFVDVIQPPVKGGSFTSYEDAGHEGYKKAGKEINRIIKDYFKL